MSWTMTDACDDREGIRLRFYTSDRALVWPNARQQDYLLGRGGTRRFELSVTPGSNVCYGGKPDRATAESWGLGIDGTKACKDCCYSGTTSDVRLQLTCPWHKSYEEKTYVNEPAPPVNGRIPSSSTTPSDQQSYNPTPRYRQNYDSAPRIRQYRPPSTGEDLGNSRRTPQARREVPYKHIVQLNIRVTGHFNQIAVSEVENPDDANIGSFLIEGARQYHRFRLLAGMGGVIHIQGDGNIVRLPAHLCRRIRVLPGGADNHIEGCD